MNPRLLWCMAVLPFFLLALPLQASTVFAIGYTTNSPALKLFSISADGSRTIAELKGQVWYGMDEDSLAFLEVDGPAGHGARVLVLDRETLAPVMDKVFTNAHAWPLKIPTAGTLAVRSKDSTLYFNGYGPMPDGKIGFGYEEVNWKTGETHPLPSNPAEGVIYATPEALPNGLVSVGYTRGIALYTETTRRLLPMPATNGWANREVYFVPGIGLMEYYGGDNRRLTDENLSIMDEQPVLFSNTNISSGIMVRDLKGKPFLIWGEDHSADPKTVRSSAITEIVVFDPVARKEVLRKPLGGKYGNLTPDRTGAKIYFVKPGSQEIYCFDRGSGTVDLFTKMELAHFDDWNGFIIAAN